MAGTAAVGDPFHLGVNVAGFLREGLGLGEAGRLYVTALQAAGVPVRTTAVDVPLPEVIGASGAPASRKLAEFAALETDAECPFNLICVNAPEMPLFYADVGEEFFRGKRSIGVWAWEVDRLSEEWSYAFDLVDEVWVYSTYVEEILSRAVPVPVVRVPLPVVQREAVGPRPDLGLRERFTFLFLFDFYSTLERKNPLGLIEAFSRAFRPGEAQLLLKSFNGDFKPDRLRRVQEAASSHPDVHVVDRYLTGGEKAALMASCDCYVSLHRAEGFGLTLAEAMALGKPAIATGFSGNTDFMTGDNSFLVTYSLTEVGPEGENYPEDGLWADPDLDHAAKLMREVYEDREGAAAKAARGRAEVLGQLTPERVGAAARSRLERLEAAGLLHPRLARRRPRMPAGWAPLQRAEGKVRFDRSAAAAKEGGAKNLARRAALRAMRPYSYHQDELSEAVVQALRELVERVGEIDRLVSPLEGEFNLEEQGRDLGRVLRGMRARPASSHPAISFEDERGALALGFERGHGDEWTFEDVFRADERLIRARQEVYVDVLREREWVLDLGCGRGEFLDVLREHGIRGRGVELSAEMVRHCQDKGHEVEHADALDYLRQQKDDSVPGVFAAQFVEHLQPEPLRDLLQAIEAKLAPGGMAILETVNPHSPIALKAFWTDPTHHHPLFPEVLLALCRFAGFRSGRVIFPEPTRNFNDDVYDSPDYAVVLTKRS